MKIDSSFFLYVSMFIYFFTAVLLFMSTVIFAQKKAFLIKTACAFFYLATFLGLATYILRWIESKHVPMSNNYETLLLFVVIVNFSYYFLKKTDSKKYVLAIISLILSITCAAATMLKTAPKDISPALQSSWLSFHVLTNIIAYSLFTLAFVAAIVYCTKKEQEKKVEVLIYKSILLAVPFLTLGIVSGAIWADAAWGRYWSWDPKETWALICWLYYILILHLRIKKLVKQKTIALLAIIGFFVVIFTFFGVNYFLGGLHSYK